MDCILVEQTTRQEMTKNTEHLLFTVSKISFYFFIFTCDNDDSVQRLLKKLNNTLELVLRCSREARTIKMSVNFALSLLI